MIKIEIFRDLQGDVEGFKIVGHANTAPHGKDIVCAAVSTLAQTALLGVESYLGKPVDYNISSGNLQMRLMSKPDELTNAIFETMILGLSEIENINPKSVQILEHGR